MQYMDDLPDSPENRMVSSGSWSITPLAFSSRRAVLAGSLTSLMMKRTSLPTSPPMSCERLPRTGCFAHSYKYLSSCMALQRLTMPSMLMAGSSNGAPQLNRCAHGAAADSHRSYKPAQVILPREHSEGRDEPTAPKRQPGASTCRASGGQTTQEGPPSCKKAQRLFRIES